MGAASAYLRELGKPRLDSTELDRFISCIAAESEKDERQAALDHLLRIVDLTPDQVIHIAASAPVRGAVGLQLAISRYARSKEIEAAQQSAPNEATWKKVLLSLGAILPPC